MKKLVSIFVSCSALAALCACVSNQAPEPPTIDLSTFTTEGKPTKTVETPWGRYELYDPLQDSDVEDIFDYVYADGQGRKTIKFDAVLKPYGDFLNRIVETQKNDLARAGCVEPVFRQCKDDIIKIGNLSSCPKLDFGKPTLNSCEAENIERLIAADDDRPLGSEDSPLLCEFRHMEAIGIGNPSNKNSKRARFEQFFDFACSIEDNFNPKQGE